MQQLSGLDAAFLYMENDSAPMHIGGLAIYDQSEAPDGLIRFKDILEQLESRLHLARCYRQKIIDVPLNLDYPYWIEDSNFDLEFHVRHIALPKPGDWRQLCIQVARLHSRPLDRARPLWEMYIIEGLDNVPGLPKNSFAVFSKIHHAAIDGASGAEITGSLHDIVPGAEPPMPTEAWIPERDPATLELLARTQVNNIRQPFRLMNVMRQRVPAFARAMSQLQRDKKVPNARVAPRTRFNGQVSPHRAFEGRTFLLDEVKGIRKFVEGATVNDVILTVCSGAMQKYLQAKNELPSETLIAGAPINVRSKNEEGSAGNQVSMMLLPLHTDIEDPLLRLETIYESTQSTKEVNEAVDARTMTDFYQFVPAALAGLAGRLYTSMGVANQMQPFLNTVITNVPGPQVPLYMGHARLIAQYGTGPVLDGMGLIQPVFSYNGTITVAATACREMMPDPEFYAECLQNSYDDLCAETINKKAPAKRRRTTRKTSSKNAK
ncbi:MAG: wax ester/triacylglycerol synthase family O-acyltransferase [Pseudomonadota bacterium]